jgi:hypothetical protein
MPPFFPLHGVLVAPAYEAQRQIAASAAAITVKWNLLESSIRHLWSRAYAIHKYTTRVKGE